MPVNGTLYKGVPVTRGCIVDFCDLQLRWRAATADSRFHALLSSQVKPSLQESHELLLGSQELRNGRLPLLSPRHFGELVSVIRIEELGPVPVQVTDGCLGSIGQLVHAALAVSPDPLECLTDKFGHILGQLASRFQVFSLACPFTLNQRDPVASTDLCTGCDHRRSSDHRQFPVSLVAFLEAFDLHAQHHKMRDAPLPYGLRCGTRSETSSFSELPRPTSHNWRWGILEAGSHARIRLA